MTFPDTSSHRMTSPRVASHKTNLLSSKRLGERSQEKKIIDAGERVLSRSRAEPLNRSDLHQLQLDGPRVPFHFGAGPSSQGRNHAIPQARAIGLSQRASRLKTEGCVGFAVYRLADIIPCTFSLVELDSYASID